MPLKGQRLIEKKHMALKDTKHGVMMFNVNDAYIGRSLDIYGEWCERELELLQKIIKPGFWVIDAGANIGTHTLFFANQVTEKGRVLAFEPQRLIYQTLCGNIALNAHLNVQCLQVALGDKRGSAKLPVVHPEKEFNFGCLAAEGHEHGEMVEVMPIDALGLPCCHLIKIDVEGMESKVLQGAQMTIERCRPILFVENNRLEGSKDLIQSLQGLDYDCYWHIVPYYNPSNYFANRVNIFKNIQPEVNMVCFPKGSQVNIDELIEVENEDDNWEKAYRRHCHANNN